jgi:uncharacterized protein (DUF697 family)
LTSDGYIWDQSIGATLDHDQTSGPRPVVPANTDALRRGAASGASQPMSSSTSKTSPTTTDDAAVEAVAVTEAELEHDAERVIQDHVLLAVVAGLIPSPAIDMVASFAVQMTMVKRLANVYDVPFREDWAKTTLSSLLGTVGGAGAAGLAASSFLKAIPIVGTVVGIVGTSVAFGAFTYGIGKVFQRHFELGGSFIDLDPRAYRDYFRDMRERGRGVAASRRREAEETARARRRARRASTTAASA